MQLSLQTEEVAMLSRILTNYVSDLRMEIAGTENYDMRESMKRDEASVKSIVAKLSEESAAAA